MLPGRSPTIFLKMRLLDTKLGLAAATNNMPNKSDVVGKCPVVVVVEDDPAVRGSLKFSLELEGFAVRTYGSGLEFFLSGDHACDCFVIDQRMPGMNGMDLIGKLRERKVMTPAILIISHPHAALSARAAAAGVSIVEKPLLGNALVDKIREACGGTRA